MVSALPNDSADTATKSTAELTSQLAHQVAELVHDEFALVQSEMTEKGKQAGRGAGMLGGAALFGLAALVCLTGCVVAAIALALPVWAAALIVGAAYLLLAGITALAGRKDLERAAPPVPSESIDHAKEDVGWIKTEVTSRAQ
ncbi:MAG TPA: phage holin family protein [Acidimicrobiia bacterium]|jgi:uncharacterized membrane protein YqjE|nr:phage holin family protein [Acidimicrobiia bacterium]